MQKYKVTLRVGKTYVLMNPYTTFEVDKPLIVDQDVVDAIAEDYYGATYNIKTSVGRQEEVKKIGSFEIEEFGDEEEDVEPSKEIKKGKGGRKKGKEEQEESDPFEDLDLG